MQSELLLSIVDLRPRLALEESLQRAAQLDPLVLELLLGELGLPVAVVHKQRLSGRDVKAQGVVGDVKGKHPVLVDDMISTGGTLAAAAQAVLDEGAEGPVTVVASHGLFVGPANERLSKVPLARVVVSDSVPKPAGLTFPLERVSCAPVLADEVHLQQVVLNLLINAEQALRFAGSLLGHALVWSEPVPLPAN